MKSLLLASLLLLAGTGCTPKYSCKGYPDKAACLSATEAYQATESTPGEPGTRTQKTAASSPEPANRLEPLDIRRSETRLLRIWNAPFETLEGDLEGARYTVAEIEPRHWEIQGARVKPLRTWPTLTAAETPRAAASHTPKTPSIVEDDEDEDLDPSH